MVGIVWSIVIIKDGTEDVTFEFDKTSERYCSGFMSYESVVLVCSVFFL